MCLGVPARVLAVRDGKAVVESRGWRREADASAVETKVGDYVSVVHNLVVAVLDPQEAEEALAAWREVMGHA